MVCKKIITNLEDLVCICNIERLAQSNESDSYDLNFDGNKNSNRDFPLYNYGYEDTLWF